MMISAMGNNKAVGLQVRQWLLIQLEVLIEKQINRDVRVERKGAICVYEERPFQEEEEHT